MTRKSSKRKEPKRRVLAVQEKATKRWIAVKENRKVSEAKAEFRAMQSYRDCTHLVRPVRFFRRKGKGCIAMEWIPGHTLRETIRRHGAFEPAKAAAIALNILSGLQELHRCGYVHADLHSGNVIITNLSQGKVKIIDLQHAVPLNRRGRAKAKRRLSQPPPALAPESKKNLIDVGYDLYGVGYMTAAMLLGREPKESLRRESLRKARRKRVLSLEESDALMARRLWAVALRGASRDPKNRYPSAEAMAQAVAGAVAGATLGTGAMEAAGESPDGAASAAK